VDGLFVCDLPKTLAALQRQFLDATDPPHWVDFLRISPWSVTEARDALRRHQVTWLKELVRATTAPSTTPIRLCQICVRHGLNAASRRSSKRSGHLAGVIH
jgi:hypothetical protein